MYKLKNTLLHSLLSVSLLSLSGVAFADGIEQRPLGPAAPVTPEGIQPHYSGDTTPNDEQVSYGIYRGRPYYYAPYYYYYPYRPYFYHYYYYPYRPYYYYYGW
jgi:hypothetical protein